MECEHPFPSSQIIGNKKWTYSATQYYNRFSNFPLSVQYKKAITTFEKAKTYVKRKIIQTRRQNIKRR